MRFSLAISHTPWAPERVESLARLHAVLRHAADPRVTYKLFADKEPNHVWSEKMWAWSAAQDVEWCVFLQDDAEVAPYFFDRLAEVIAGTAEGIIGLHAPHPAAVPLAREGCAGFTTRDGLVGVGYAVRAGALADFLEWRAALPVGAVEAIAEDSLLGLYAAVAVAGANVYHPIPALVDHDTRVPSTYGNDSHVNRRSRVRWDSELIVDREHHTRRVPHLGCFYTSTPHTAKKWGMVDANGFRELLADDGAREARRINHAVRAAGAVEPIARVLIATPVRGGVHPNYAASVWRMLQDEQVDYESSLEIPLVQLWGEDLVRIRSRFVSYFLNQTDCTHLLFLDSDIEVTPNVVRGMLAANRDFVAAPYPRRDGIDFTRVREQRDLAPEGVAYRYSVRCIDNQLTLGKDGCAEVEMVPLGCALLNRVGLQNMSVYFSELAFDDAGHGPSVALFQLVLSDRNLLSEDYSFCARWREMGQKVYMFLGDGSPVAHHGEHRYGGNIEAFGLRRL